MACRQSAVKAGIGCTVHGHVSGGGGWCSRRAARERQLADPVDMLQFGDGPCGAVRMVATPVGSSHFPGAEHPGGGTR